MSAAALNRAAHDLNRAAREYVAAMLGVENRTPNPVARLQQAALDYARALGWRPPEAPYPLPTSGPGASDWSGDPNASDPPRRTEREMKVYLWRGVLVDYTDGMVFAFAESREDAIRLVRERLATKGAFERDGWLPENKIDGTKIDGVEPEEIDGPFAFALWGGG